MSLFDIFRSKPKQCTSCWGTFPRLHRVYSGLRHGAVTDQLCTGCLISRLETRIQGTHILFIEPLTTDGYCCAPFGDVGNQGLTQDRVRLALSSLEPKCADCASEPHHLWMLLSDLDESAMEKQPNGRYCSIPGEPVQWKQTVSLCDKHVAARFRDYLERKSYFFLTFRFPEGGDAGYYS